MYKITIFGTGSGADKIINSLKEDIEVIVFVDNNIEKHNTIYKGKKVINPVEINEYSYDAIVIGSQYNFEIKKQLIKMEIDKNKIFDFYHYIQQKFNYIEYYISCFGKSEVDYELIITGLSYALKGFDIKSCKKKSFSFCFASQDIYYDYNIVKYLINNCKNKMSKIKYCVIGLSYYSFQYDLSLSSMKDKVLEYYKALGLIHNLKDFKLTNTNSDFEINKNIANKIFYFNEYNNEIIKWEKKGISKVIDKVSVGKAQADLDCDKNYVETVKENIILIQEYLNILENNNIKPIIVVFPASKYYTECFSKRIEDEFHSIINELRKNHTFQYIDYFRNEQFEDKDFEDVSHLSPVGATKFTKILNNEIEW